MSEDPVSYGPDGPSADAIAQALATCDSLDRTAAAVWKAIAPGDKEAQSVSRLRPLAPLARQIAAGLARLQASVAEAQEAIPRLEARRTALEEAVRVAGAAYFSAEAKAQRQHRDVQLGNLQLQIDAVRAEKEKLLAALSL